MIPVVLLLLGIALVFGLAALISRSMAQGAARFAAQGVSTSAEVTNLDKRRIRGVILDSTGYWVGYTYFAEEDSPDRVRRASNYRISEYAFNQLKVGGPIEIVYLRSQPDSSRPADSYLDSDVERSNQRSPYYFAAGVAAFLLVIAVTVASRAATQNAAVEAVNAQVQAELAEIHSAVDSKISGWRTLAQSHVTRLSAADAGFSPQSEVREVYYGKCAANPSGFYLIVMRQLSTGTSSQPDWIGMGYGYITGAEKLAGCVPEGWNVLSEKPDQNDWRAIALIYPAQIPFYQLTATARATGLP